MNFSLQTRLHGRESAETAPLFQMAPKHRPWLKAGVQPYWVLARVFGQSDQKSSSSLCWHSDCGDTTIGGMDVGITSKLKEKLERKWHMIIEGLPKMNDFFYAKNTEIFWMEKVKINLIDFLKINLPEFVKKVANIPRFFVRGKTNIKRHKNMISSNKHRKNVFF